MRIGEALIGNEPELAHIDLLIGDKKGPVGTAFASGLSHLSKGHTPLLAVIRPNLPTKPATLIVPKVTIQNLEQAAKMFGPAQAAVAKAVADAVEDGVIPQELVEDYVLIISVFLHPDAKDYDKIYRYNYGATKLAIKRALSDFPSIETVLYEKDRAMHPVMGFKVTKLWNPPYLQVAFDLTDLSAVLSVMDKLPINDHLVLEAGTPLIKRYGLGVIREMRKVRPSSFIVADLKILDTGNLEARMAADETSDAVVVSGLASTTTIDKAIEEANKTGIYVIIDMLNVDKPEVVLKSLKNKPDVVELHRAIDVEHTSHAWGNITNIKKYCKLVAVAGGIREDNIGEALTAGADILVVGRAITAAKDVEGAARIFLEGLKQTDIDQFRIKTDF
ncbi:MAG TPA: bifunctional 5,6,7,8-tetrahydromethanopterin hydro-lyase/3-hexulose-6-phosphate synthase [Candidatus Acidoferrales bacterium]|nr:bifunctional 5,6,7,8-tetrahydromethanopterin hydro-lyase/3-hexulose-6-phosphate synthase [Candidatus Acidoferrales bacterium]